MDTTLTGICLVALIVAGLLLLSYLFFCERFVSFVGTVIPARKKPMHHKHFPPQHGSGDSDEVMRDDAGRVD